MYYDFEVEIPTEKGKVSKRTRGNSIFVEYKEKEQYDNNKGYSVAKRVTIGKVSDSNKNTMYPNEVYFDMFCPDEKPESVTNENRNMALGFGMYAVLDSIFEELKIPQILKKTIDPNHKPELILDLIAYSIITENNASIYYPDYAEGHVLFSKDMHIYYESTVGRVFRSITNDERQDFFEEWNKLRKKENTEETIYISYDSTNKNIQDSNIELSECENEKINISERVINYAIAYDGSNEIPLFYEVYPGDTVQIKELVARAHKFGYNNISFILDRGYISKSNINEMDDNGFDFMIFINTLNNEINNLYLENKNQFVNQRKCLVEDYGAYGITIKAPLFTGDEKERYFHLYYDHQRAYYEKKDFDKILNRTKAFLDTVIGKKNIEFSQYEKKFFNILTDKNGTVISYTEKEDITQQSEECFGFFSLVTSSKMTFDEAIHLYKSRDNFEKLFMADKTFLGGRAYKVQSVESSENKSFIEFLALIVRNRMFTILQEGKKQSKTNDNFYLVPKAIKELDKIMLCENLNGDYRMNKNITAPCQKLISLFGLSIKSLREKALKVSDKLKVTRDSISLEARLEREETTQEEMYENTMYID